MITIGMDFDGTLCGRSGEPYPSCAGHDLGASKWMQQAELEFPGQVRWHLWTCRHDEALGLAVDWLFYKGYRYRFNWGGFNENNEGLAGFPFSNKMYCALYVDDRAIGAPLDAIGNLVWDVAGIQLIESIRARLAGSW